MYKLKFFLKALVSRFPTYSIIGFIAALVLAMNFYWGGGIAMSIIAGAAAMDMGAYIRKAIELEKNQ